MNVKGGDAHWAKQVPDGHTGGSPSGDMFPYWPPVWLSTQGDPGIPTAEHREAADWPGRNKSPALPPSHLGPPGPQRPILRHLRGHQPEDSGEGSFVVEQRSSLPWATEGPATTFLAERCSGRQRGLRG